MSDKIYTYSIITSAAEAFKDKCPYVIAIVERDDGSHVMARVEGYSEGQPVSIGMPVAAVGADEQGYAVYKFA